MAWLPWLATMVARDALAIAAVAAAVRLPWLLFSVPAGVVVDRHDQRRLIAGADLMRALLVGAILVLALGSPGPGAVWLLAGLAFLLGSAEVPRDNAAQTILPTLVETGELEAANDQMWSAEQLTGQFVGPTLAGLLIGLGIALPCGVDIAALLLAAGLVWLIAFTPQPRGGESFSQALKEGVGYMHADRLLLRLALALGAANFIATAVITVQVLLVQEVLELDAVGYGTILSVEAVGAIAGSLAAPWLIRVVGLHRCLVGAIAVWGIGYGAVGMTGTPVVMAAALFAVLFAAMVWNVITVSWRQRRIPRGLLGRVNSIYRFFGWGSMPLGALAGGALVSLLDGPLSRELALRAPFLAAAGLCLLLMLFAMRKLRLE